MSQQLCNFFLLGNCRFGAACPYVHDQKSTSNQSTMPTKQDMPVCYYYQQGTCLHGDQCFYRHSRDTAAVVQEPCWYLRENGWCNKGQECRFSHDLNLLAVVSAQQNLNPIPNNNETTTAIQQNDYFNYSNNVDLISQSINNLRLPKRGESTVNKCIYYAKGHCMRGDKCGYIHDDPNDEDNSQSSQMTLDEYLQLQKQQNKASSTTTTSSKSLPNASSKQATIKKLPENLSQCSEEELNLLKKNEETNILRRIPTDKLKIIESSKQSEYEIEFHPTDPNWEYSISEIPLIIILQVGYPKNKLIAQISSGDRLPITIIQYVNEAIDEWIESYHADLLAEDRVELYFRTFLHWFDRNIAGLFSEGLELHRDELAKKLSAVVPDREETTNEEQEIDSTSSSAVASGGAAGGGSTSTVAISRNNPSIVKPTRRGIEIYLRNFQIREPLDCLWFSQLSINMQCGRCKSSTVCLLEHGKMMKQHCEKCGAFQLAAYRGALLFQTSAILGYLDVNLIQPIDLIFPDCQALLHCSQCDEEFMKDNLERLTKNEPRCKQCHSKCLITFEGIRFTRLNVENDELNVEEKNTTIKIKKLPKDPFIRPGFPLPADGSCKHYRQSNRWFRFPCCGRTFPCDVCHNESVEDGHVAMFATNVICGFCSKEQHQTVDKQCVSCHKYMTKRPTSHWEGGKGCRDKVKMNRNDPKKYLNSNKTSSKKSSKGKS